MRMALKKASAEADQNSLQIFYYSGHAVTETDGTTWLFPIDGDVDRLRETISFDGTKVLYNWLGATRLDWRGQGHFRALTEESEAWAIEQGFHEVVVKTKNRFYDMRGMLAHLRFDVIKHEPAPGDHRNSKVYLSKQLTADVLRGHISARMVTLA